MHAIAAGLQAHLEGRSGGVRRGGRPVLQHSMDGLARVCARSGPELQGTEGAAHHRCALIRRHDAQLIQRTAWYGCDVCQQHLRQRTACCRPCHLAEHAVDELSVNSINVNKWHIQWGPPQGAWPCARRWPAGTARWHTLCRPSRSSPSSMLSTRSVCACALPSCEAAHPLSTLIWQVCISTGVSKLARQKANRRSRCVAQRTYDLTSSPMEAPHRPVLHDQARVIAASALRVP
jgi:hypothetical protein